MKLQFRFAFGNFKPGDEVEVADDAAYDTYYLTPATDTPPTDEDPPADPDKDDE